MEEEINSIEIRSEEIEEILGKAPNWIIRRGIVVVFSVIALLFIGSWFFNYPDAIVSRIIITSENVPAAIVAKTSGKITDIFVKDNELVQKNQYLAILENPANYNHIKEIKNKLDSMRPFIMDLDSLKNRMIISFHSIYLLGDMQTQFSAFRKNYEDYIEFIKMDYQHKKIASLQQQNSKYKQLYYKLLKQQDIMQQKLALGNIQYDRDSSLYSNKTIASADFEKSQGTLLDNKYTYTGSGITIDNTLIAMNQLDQSILEMEQDYAEKKKQYELLLKESYDNLQSQINQWEQTYVLKSPINGVITFTKFWNINQNVVAGDKVMTVIPKEINKIMGKLTLPVIGSGKVKAGQKVNIKLDNYPYMEYGMIEGKIKSISLIPSDNTYMAEVEFPEGLKTNYNKQLKFSQEMQGTADVITEDIRLFKRLFNPFKALFKNNIASTDISNQTSSYYTSATTKSQLQSNPVDTNNNIVADKNSGDTVLVPLNSAYPSGIIFKVQISAGKKYLSLRSFKGVTPLTTETTPDGWIRYLAGEFTKIEDACIAKKQFKALGYKDAFVVAYHNGKRVSISDAVTILKSNK